MAVHVNAGRSGFGRSRAWGRRRRSIILRLGRARAARVRRRYAEGLEGAVERAGKPRTAFTSAIPVSREATGDARGVLLDLAERLRQPRPVRSEGLAMVKLLLCDGAGPLFCGEPGELRREAELALLALDVDVSAP